MVGYTLRDLEGGELDWQRMTPPEWRATDEAALQELHAKGVTTPFEKEFLRKDGTRVPVLLSAACFSGVPNRGLTLCLDMTEAKRAQRELSLAVEQANLAVKEKDAVLQVVSHDLRNPLETISLVTQVLQRDPPQERRQKFVNTLAAAAEQMKMLVGDLLEVTKAGGGRFQIAPTPQQADDLLQRACEQLRPLAHARGISLEIEDGDSVSVGADSARILQVLSNLVSNALDHTPPHGTIRLGARRVGERCVFHVQDSGRGIDSKDLPYVFDRFWRGPNAEVRPGAGLGLAICKGIVEAHRGTIRVRSDPDTGARFEFDLPAG